MRVPWTTFNGGVFLILFGGLLFASLAGLSPYNPLQSFMLTIMIFGVWLALAAFVLTPREPHGPHSTLVFGWGTILAGLGFFFFVAVTSVSLLPLVFALLVILAGIGALGYSLLHSSGNSRKSPASPTGTSNF